MSERKEKRYRIYSVFGGLWLLNFEGVFTAEEAAPLVCEWNARHETHDMIAMEEIVEAEAPLW